MNTNEMDRLKTLSKTMREWSDTTGDHHWLAHLAIERLIALEQLEEAYEKMAEDMKDEIDLGS